ncbi:uncharacterized protein LOC144785248 [Lissotriton helveticus]
MTIPQAPSAPKLKEVSAPRQSTSIDKELIKKYKAAPKDPIFIKGQIPLDSLVVTNARKRANSLTTGEAPPPDKESKLIDASGKRVASQAANSWRIANTQALLARYDRAHYDELEKLITHLPKEHQKKADQLLQEGKIITNASIKCALDAADTAARSINTSIMLRRHAWLRVSGFKQEVQTSLLNQPFDEKTLFGSGTDEALEKMKKDTETAKSMGALQQPTQRGSFRRSTYRGGSKNTGTSQQPTSFTPTSPREEDDNQRQSDEGNSFRAARSPSELLTKMQEEDHEEEEFFPAPVAQAPAAVPPAQMPLDLLTNLQYMLNDYYCRFPPSESA